MKERRFGLVQYGILLLVAATALIHLWLGLQFGLTMFILNGIGYLVLAAALYLPQLKSYRTYIRWALILFTAVTVVAWAAIGDRNLIGYLDKAVEVALIALLFVEMRQS